MKTITTYNKSANRRSISELDFPLPKFRYHLKLGDIISFEDELSVYEVEISDYSSTFSIAATIIPEGSQMHIETLLRYPTFKNWAYDYERSLVFANNGERFQALWNECKTYQELFAKLQGRTLKVVNVQAYTAKVSCDRLAFKTVYGFELI